MPDQYCVVMMTAPDMAVADKISQGLVEGRLAACVNRVPGVSSIYRWEGKTKIADEVLLIAKSKLALSSEIVAFVRRNHPFAVPEVVILPVDGGHPLFLNWIGANTRFAKPKAAERLRPQ